MFGCPQPSSESDFESGNGAQVVGCVASLVVGSGRFGVSAVIAETVYGR